MGESSDRRRVGGSKRIKKDQKRSKFFLIPIKDNKCYYHSNNAK